MFGWSCRSRAAVAALLVLCAGALGCEGQPQAVVVRLEERAPLPPEPYETGDQGVLRVAIGSMITPQEGFAYYRDLGHYLGRELERTVRLVDKRSYAETNELLRTGAVDVAFVCGRPYVDGRDAFGLELLAVPQVRGETVYHSLVIVPEQSQVRDMLGLRGKTFAFTDPHSNSGRLAPTYLLGRLGETPEGFFARYVFTYAHDESIRAVARGVVDGAAVDSLIWEYVASRHPEMTARTRVVWTSPPYGIPPVAASPHLEPGLKSRVRELLLGLHEGEEGRGILAGLMVERFVEGDDRSYDTIRAMKAWEATQPEAPRLSGQGGE